MNEFPVDQMKEVNRLKGLVHIYSGDGKGKTSAAIGLGIRAFGRGMSVMLTQFLKSAGSGELHTIGMLGPGFEVVRGRKAVKFLCDMNEKELIETGEQQRELFEMTASKIKTGKYNILILDELLGVIENGMIDIGCVVDFVINKPEDLELVITGRKAPAELAELADYHSEIKCIKHPIEKGIRARKGIEN